MVTETWRPVRDYEGLYEVSDFGRVRSLDRIDSGNRNLKGKVLVPCFSTSGYVKVTLCHLGARKDRRIHQMVLEAFTSPAPSTAHHARHHNGVKTDNRLSNLLWGTPKENSADSIRLGVMYRGEQCAKVKFCQLDIELIREIALTVPRLTIARWFGVANSTICRIVNRETWAHI